MNNRNWTRSRIVWMFGLAIIVAAGPRLACAQTDQQQSTSGQQTQQHHKHKHTQKQQTTSDGQTAEPSTQSQAPKQ
jgi:hypothetical protein